MRSGLDPRFEKTQNLVSTNVPEVIESLRASCSGNGIAMAKVATPTMGELSGALDEFRRCTWFSEAGYLQRLYNIQLYSTRNIEKL